MATHAPRAIPQVMVSSTFTDLQDHRAALIKAIHEHKLHANIMENDSARLIDVIDSSLEMVRDSAAYIGVIGLKYGQTPDCPKRNPAKLSITELEFDEAQRLGRPILLFVMGDDHPVKKADIEKDLKKEKKLNAFRERAKKGEPGSSVNRVYAVFNSFEEFKDKLGSSLAELGTHLESQGEKVDAPTPRADGHTPIPKPPAFYAEPDYIGSHKFVGRDSQLQELSDWAKPADPTNLLLFEAIGGNGKSMLTWEWTTNHATKVRTDWAGRFWYSFYEKGAIMADFCQRALAYMTGQPLEHFAKKKTAELAKELLAQLHAKPWLFILDGLERVLVAYHRIDAAEVPDEEANIPTDKIVNRNPCDAIRDEDNDLLRQLAAAAPSKLLVSSRLTPRVLLNPSGQPISGSRRITLPGLRPPDAEKLLRSCGIEGDSAAIQDYLTKNCDNHPLVIGVLGGLVNNYRENRGNFDAWMADPHAGAALNLSELDLIQRRNHILRAALDDLLPESRVLLSTLALISDSVDYETLKAFNPHLPPELEAVEQPEPPENHRHLAEGVKVHLNDSSMSLDQPSQFFINGLFHSMKDGERDKLFMPWERLSSTRKTKMQKQYRSDFKRWKKYESAVNARMDSMEYRVAPKKLETTVDDLERRGLVQWSGSDRKYNIHPVIRGVVAGAMRADDKRRHGLRVIDHFTKISDRPHLEAKSLQDIARTGFTTLSTAEIRGLYGVVKPVLVVCT